jgi:preprotein translocase subunit SecG
MLATVTGASSRTSRSSGFFAGATGAATADMSVVSAILATLRLLAALAMCCSIRERMRASRAPPEAPPSTTATMWRLPRRTDDTRLKPDMRV